MMNSNINSLNKISNLCYFSPKLMKDNSALIKSLNDRLTVLENSDVLNGVYVVEQGGTNSLGYRVWSDGLIENWGYVSASTTVQFLRPHTIIPELSTSMELSGGSTINGGSYHYNLTTISVYLIINKVIIRHNFRTIGY